MALLALLIAFALLYFVLRIVSMLWRGVEQVLNETLSGVRLFCVLAWRSGRLALLAAQYARCYVCIVSLWAARHVHAALYAWGYVLRRRYIASELRHIRRMRNSA